MVDANETQTYIHLHLKEESVLVIVCFNFFHNGFINKWCFTIYHTAGVN